VDCAFFFYRAYFANPIYAYMDCQSVMKIVQRNWKASSDAPEDRAFGALVQAILQVSAPQHPSIEYTQCYPENSRGATATVLGRSAIPRKDWTLQNHLNVLADTYSEPQLPTGLPAALIPHRIMEVEVSVLLNAVMPMNGLYWQHDGMPTVNQVESMSTQKTEDYLQQRSEAGSYYETRYWPGSDLTLTLTPPPEIIKQPGDIPDSWVAQSHFFPDAGLGFFFEIKGPYKRRGGALLAVYYGQDSYTRKFSKHSHKQLTELWSRGGGVLSHRGANYVVNGDPACESKDKGFSGPRKIRSAGQL
jgi:hypothetical protein